jgi:hypothetical protein
MAATSVDKAGLSCVFWQSYSSMVTTGQLSFLGSGSGEKRSQPRGIGVLGDQWDEKKVESLEKSWGYTLGRKYLRGLWGVPHVGTVCERANRFSGSSQTWVKMDGICELDHKLSSRFTQASLGAWYCTWRLLLQLWRTGAWRPPLG